jgi:hypothetical protein
MAFELNLLKPNPAPAPTVSLVPGCTLLKSVALTPVNYREATTLAAMTVDAPVDATFAKYRKILFQFYGIGFANGNSTDLTIRPRRTGQNYTNNVFYQINQITSTTATGWINTNNSGAIAFTTGNLMNNSYPVNSLNIIMHPMGYDIDFSLGSNTTLATGSIGKATGTYTVPASGQAPMALLDYPGLTLACTGSNFFTAWNYATSTLAQQHISCDIYGFLRA